MSSPKTRILILGAGFGGLYAALHLDRTLAADPALEITLINKTNFTLFTPMLHEVASGDLDASDIVNPVRKMLKRVTFIKAIVHAIDLKAKTVAMHYGVPRQTLELQYDHLVLALGSITRFFDPQTRENAMQFKSMGDAVFLRSRVISSLEAAAVEQDTGARQRLLTFAVAGGGFSGVELIGGLNDLLRDSLKYYRTLDPSMVRVVLIHPGKVLLPEFSESLGRYTTERLRDVGIDVRLETKVASYDGQTVQLDPGDPIQAGMLLWTAGVVPPPLIESLPMKKVKGRVVVKSTMESEEYPGVWALGDIAHIPNPKTGEPYPATAQHAIREGARLGKNIEATVRGKPQKPFTYKMMGQLAAIGSRRGAANIMGINFSGFIAWWMWRTIYLSKLPRLDKKLRVATSWTIDLFFSRDLVQMVTIDEIEKITRFGLRYKLGESESADAYRDGPIPGEHAPIDHDAGAAPSSDPQSDSASIEPTS